jgi:hypothetical protein
MRRNPLRSFRFWFHGHSKCSLPSCPGLASKLRQPPSPSLSGKERRHTLSGLGRNGYSIGLEVRLVLRDRLRRSRGIDTLTSGETLLASTEAQWRQWFVHASPWSLAYSLPLIFERGLVSSWSAIAVRECLGYDPWKPQVSPNVFLCLPLSCKEASVRSSLVLFSSFKIFSFSTSTLGLLSSTLTVRQSLLRPFVGFFIRLLRFQDSFIASLLRLLWCLFVFRTRPFCRFDSS